MPEYKYKAAKLSGKTVNGRMQARDSEDLRNRLKEDGLFLQDHDRIQSASKKTKLKAQQLSEFCRETGTMLGAGVPLIRALNIMANRDIPQKIKSVYQSIYQSLKQGLMLSEALEETGGFPDLLVSMFRASEISGQMDITAIKMADHYQKSHRLSKKVRSAMVYPIILSVVTVIVLLVVFLVVLPKFFSLFATLDTELPGITQFMLGLSTFLLDNWIWVLIGVLVLVLALRMLVQIKPVKRVRDQIRLHLPVVGKLLRIIYTARFSRVLSSTYSSGVSVVNSLLSAKDTVINSHITSQFPAMVQKVKNGSTLSEAIASIDGFDSKLSATVLIGEETGKLDDMLNTMAESFDYDADVSLQRLTALLEPCMIVIIAGIIGLVIVSVILPLTTLYSAIGASA